jgi:hypothetical protein
VFSHSRPPAHAGHGWILAAAPSGAERFRTDDEAIADTLAAAGAEVVSGGAADAELLRRSPPSGNAPVAALDLGRSPNDAARRERRVAERLARAARTAAGTPAAVRALRRLGYAVSVVRWDLDHPLRVPSLPPAALAPVQRAPRRALVVGTRAPGGTMLEAAIGAARRELPGLEPRWPSVREALLVSVTPAGVLRVGLGPAGAEMDVVVARLEALRSSSPPPAVADRTPWPLARGREGLADWLVERLLPGTQPQRLDPSVLDDCVEFLVALFACDSGAWTARGAAERIAAAAPEAAAEVTELAERLDRELAGLPCGFAHGDFWSGNLLVDSGRLRGVIDWDGAAAARPPFLDLLHLLLVDARRPSATTWGPALVDHLLPWAARGGDEVSARYGAAIGVEPAPALLRSLAAAYWLERAAFQLTTFADRRRRPAWLEANLRTPLRAFASA